VREDQEIAPILEQSLTRIPDASRAFFKPLWWILLSLFGLLPLYCAYQWWRHRQQATSEAPDDPIEQLKQVFDAPDKPPYFIPFKKKTHVIHAGKKLYDFANTLRRRQEGLRKELHVEKSLQATIENGGFPHIHMERSTQPTEYLFLIDDQHRDSIQSRLFEYLVDFLKKRDVYAERFFYRDEPYSIWQKKEGETFNLPQLQRLYPQYRFILMGDAHRLLSQMGEDALALKPSYTSSLERWESRCLLSPLPPVSWTYKEAGLHRWLPVYPVDMEGVEDAFEDLQVTQEELHLPATFARWQKQQTETRTDVDVNYRIWRKLEVLKAYLKPHPALWRWLCALSVHPVISWPLTLAIGNALDEKGDLVTFDHLLILSRIPWLQQGHFPPRLRLELLEALDRETEILARETLRAELKDAEEEASGGFANFEVQAGLAVQNFLIAPEVKEHQEQIHELTKGAKPTIGKHRYKELDQQIRKYLKGKGQKEEGLQVFLRQQAAQHATEDRDAKPQANPWIKWVIGSLAIWVFLMLGSIVLNGSLILNRIAIGQSFLTPKQASTFLGINQIPPNRFAELNNKAVELSDALQQNRVKEYRTGIVQDSILQLLNEAIGLNLSVPKGILFFAENNLQKHLFNRAIFDYEGSFERLEDRRLEQAKRAFHQIKDTVKNQDSLLYLNALHASGLCQFYQKDTVGARVVLEELILTTFFSQLVPPMDSTNLGTLLDVDLRSAKDPSIPPFWTGLIIDSLTRQGLEGVLISGPGVLNPVTDQDGRYQVKVPVDVNQAQIELVFQMMGYETAIRSMRLDRADNTLETVALVKIESIDSLESPVASFEVTGREFCAPATINFSNTSSSFADSYLWGFGDGTQSTEQSPTHVYQEAGTYDVTLIVGLQNTLFDTFELRNAIEVIESSKADFTFQDSGGGIYKFINESVNASNAAWDFGTGDTSNEYNTTYQFPSNGEWLVTLVSTDAQGCRDLITRKVVVESNSYSFSAPTVFSPSGGSGEERFFRPLGTGIETYSIEIFSPAGELVWESTALQNGQPAEAWDGTLYGRPLPQGAYSWKVEIKYQNGEIDTQTGLVTLLGGSTSLPTPQMILVKGGSFQMGGDGEYYGKPVHPVTVSDFYMGKYEVTNEEYVAFLNEEGNQEEGGVTWVKLDGKYGKVECGIAKEGDRFVVKPGQEKLPMIYVSWYGARAYAKWLSRKTGKSFRLPTEAEWEYAARGGSQSKGFISAGSNEWDEVARYYANYGSKTHQVGQKKPKD